MSSAKHLGVCSAEAVLEVKCCPSNPPYTPPPGAEPFIYITSTSQMKSSREKLGAGLCPQSFILQDFQNFFHFILLASDQAKAKTGGGRQGEGSLLLEVQ